MNVLVTISFGSWTWVCLLPTLYFFFVPNEIDPPALVLFYRRNDLLQLIDSLEKQPPQPLELKDLEDD
jgi:hypothetical protein